MAENSLKNLSWKSIGQDEKSRIPRLPPLPDDVIARFPSLRQWQVEMDRWREQVVIALRGTSN